MVLLVVGVDVPLVVADVVAVVDVVGVVVSVVVKVVVGVLRLQSAKLPSAADCMALFIVSTTTPHVSPMANKNPDVVHLIWCCTFGE